MHSTLTASIVVEINHTCNHCTCILQQRRNFPSQLLGIFGIEPATRCFFPCMVLSSDCTFPCLYTSSCINVVFPLRTTLSLYVKPWHHSDRYWRSMTKSPWRNCCWYIQENRDKNKQINRLQHFGLFTNRFVYMLESLLHRTDMGSWGQDIYTNRKQNGFITS